MSRSGHRFARHARVLLYAAPLAGGELVRGRISIDGRLKACLFVAWLTLSAAVIATSADAESRWVAIGAILVAACAGLLRRDWREALAVGLAGAALTAWIVGGADGEAIPLLAAAGVVVTALLAAWSRQRPEMPSVVDRSNWAMIAQSIPSTAQIASMF